MLKMDGELKSTDHMQIDSATIPGRCHSPPKMAKGHTIARYFPDVPRALPSPYLIGYSVLSAGVESLPVASVLVCS